MERQNQQNIPIDKMWGREKINYRDIVECT